MSRKPVIYRFLQKAVNSEQLRNEIIYPFTSELSRDEITEVDVTQDGATAHNVLINM